MNPTHPSSQFLHNRSPLAAGPRECGLLWTFQHSSLSHGNVLINPQNSIRAWRDSCLCSPSYISVSEADMYWITRVSILVEEKFLWMTERSPVTLLRGEEVEVCRAELLFDMSSSSHKRLSQTSAVDLPDSGGTHTFHTATLPLHLVCLCTPKFLLPSLFLFHLSVHQCGLVWRKFYWVISWFIWYFYFNEDERWWSWAVNKSIWNSEVSMWIPGVGFMHPSHSSQAWQAFDAWDTTQSPLHKTRHFQINIFSLLLLPFQLWPCMR